jgi:hypothetical protein
VLVPVLLWQAGWHVPGRVMPASPRKTGGINRLTAMEVLWALRHAVQTSSNVDAGLAQQVLEGLSVALSDLLIVTSN